ncbi:Cupredoxin [Penicillium expansum]|uniref:Cupredoxin n=1 Tax=Penicillium expansum TaxID=27334 RepID=A0A0A2IWK7_PENEN|nr:Cupredoxin [Penicillium expansum]KGO37094.1 Cupredoxin [Penicillium expansum]KGO46876.1 Cupredoxin [Penicillium expansum]KGO62356.1 Cupredoxin [Penicillium expansum]
MFVSLLAWPLAWLALATMTVAADSSTAATITTTTSSSTGITTHTVQVGPKSNPHQFVPPNITANVGDVIVFDFYPTNHSVVKADYLAPCVPANGNIFYSGAFVNFNEQDGQLIGPPTFFYCTAIDSCLKNGMVGVINANATETWETQYSRALTYPYMLVPGQSMPAEGNGSGSSSDDTSGDNNSSGSKHGLSAGAIAGITVAAVVFVAILVALFFVLGRNRVYSQWMSSEDGRTERTARWAMFNHGDQYANGKSETASSVPTHRATPSDATAVSSPDPNMRTLSPGVIVTSGPGSPSAQQGHWSWNEPPQRARTSAVATELEGHPIVLEAPGSTPGYRP